MPVTCQCPSWCYQGCGSVAKLLEASFGPRALRSRAHTGMKTGSGSSSIGARQAGFEHDAQGILEILEDRTLKLPREFLGVRKLDASWT